MTQAKPIVRALAFAFGGLGSIAVMAPSFAQTQAQPEKLERVEVTGSAIKRIEGESALPVTVITRQEIDQLGVTNVADLVNKLTANNGQGYQLANALGDSARPGFSGASLRGLGSNSTLVLLNGRRLAVYAFDGGAVNLQQIPYAAIERIEVLRDGASAIYGTDAVAGVINFITRKDYSGLQAFGGISYPTSSGGGETYSANVLGGWGNLDKDKWNVFGSLSYQDQKSLKASDRDFAKTALRRDIQQDPNETGSPFVNRLSSNAFPANVFTNNLYNPYAPRFSGPGAPLAIPYQGIFTAGCQVPYSYGTTATDSRCRYDYASRIDIIPDNEVWSFIGRGTWQINADNQIFAEATWAKQQSTFRISETPASEATTKKQPDGSQLPLLYPAGGKYYPGNGVVPAIPGQTLSGDLDLYYRTLELGPRTNQANTDEYRLLLGATGLLAGWDYNAAVYYTVSNVTEKYLGGYVLESKILPAMYTGNINPFGYNDPAGKALLQSTQVTGDMRSAKLSQWTVDGVMSKEVMNLPAGPMSAAIGFQYYSQKYNDNPSPILGSSDIIGGGGEQPVVSGTRDVYALFGELSIPIIKKLDAQVALRYDHYSDFGSNVSPKVGLRYQPSSALLLRGSFGTGFRAPTIPDMVAPPAKTNSGGVYDDPFYDTQVGCNTRFDPLYCGAQLSVTNSGNKQLQPETSKQWSLGFVWEPVRNASFGADFWWIQQKDLIGYPGGDNIISDCIGTFNAAALNCTGALAANQTFRNALIPGFGSVKVMNTAFNQIQNLADQNTNGVDIEGKLRLPPTNVGIFTLGYNATYIFGQSQKFTYVPNQDWNKTDGTYAVFGPVANYKHLLTLSWEVNSWTVTMGNNFQSSYKDQYANTDGSDRYVGAWATWDLYVRWTGMKNLTVVGGVTNLFDRTPPTTNSNSYFQVGFDPTYVNPRGQTPYINATYKFF